jgi:hypothetical protein
MTNASSCRLTFQVFASLHSSCKYFLLLYLSSKSQMVVTIGQWYIACSFLDSVSWSPTMKDFYGNPYPVRYSDTMENFGKCRTLCVDLYGLIEHPFDKRNYLEPPPNCNLVNNYPKAVISSCGVQPHLNTFRHPTSKSPQNILYLMFSEIFVTIAFRSPLGYSTA